MMAPHRNRHKTLFPRVGRVRGIGSYLCFLAGTLLHYDHRELENGFVAEGAIVYDWYDERAQDIENWTVTA